MKRLMILMLVLALLCAGCGERGHGEVETEEYPVCFGSTMPCLRARGHWTG